jgi:hypothetical protein
MEDKDIKKIEELEEKFLGLHPIEKGMTKRDLFARNLIKSIFEELTLLK